jgi:serine protease DegQ
MGPRQVAFSNARACRGSRCATPTLCAGGWRRGQFASATRGTTRGDRQLSRRRRPSRPFGSDGAFGPRVEGTAAALTRRGGEGPRLRRHHRPHRYIVTNYHVVEDASDLAVALVDGTLHLTRIVGVDTESDIALLKIDADDLRPIALTDINEVSVGDVALAVGNPLGVGQTVTQGIISAIVRKGANPVENFIQTDAAINPGNSGGALIDTAGRLVGINVAILSHSGGSEGIGFAIPVDYVQTVASELRTKGRVTRSWLGVSTAPARRGEGALVISVDPDGPADRAGIAPGDVIVRFGEKPVSHSADVRSVVIGA